MEKAAMSVSEADQWQKIVGYIIGYQATWVADIGLKAGFFQAIAEAGAPGVHEPQLAKGLGFSQRYVEVWARAAYAFELLDWDEARGYQLAPHMASLLLEPADPQFLGGRVRRRRRLAPQAIAILSAAAAPSSRAGRCSHGHHHQTARGGRPGGAAGLHPCAAGGRARHAPEPPAGR